MTFDRPSRMRRSRNSEQVRLIRGCRMTRGVAMGRRTAQVVTEGPETLEDRLVEEEALEVMDRLEGVVRPTDREDVTARSISTFRGWTQCSR